MQKLPFSLALLVLTVQSFNFLKAQEINEKNFVLYTKQQGLSDNVITDVTQDSMGYLWIATGFGLNRFNGNNFVQFHSNRDTCSLPVEYVSGLLWLNNRELAAYTGKGLHIVNTRRGESRNILIPWSDKKYQYKFNGIQAVKTNAAGEIFLVTRSGFYHFDKNCHLLFRFDYYTNQEVARTPFGFGRNLLRLDEQRFVIVTSDGLYYYNAIQRRFKKMDAADCPQMKEFLDYPKMDYEFFQPASDYLFAIDVKSNNLVCINVKKNQKTVTHVPLPSARDEFDYRSTLVAVSDTLFYLTGRVSGFYKVTLDPSSGNIQFHLKKYFPSYYCSSVFADADNTLWVATNKGLLKQDNGRMHVEWTALPSSLQDSFPTSVIDDIYAGKEKLYAGTRGDGALLIFNKKPLHLIRRISFDQLTRSPNGVYSVRPTSDGSLFIGTNGPLFSLNLKTDRLKEIELENWDKAGAWIADLCKDRNQNIWIASDNIYKYDGTTKKISLVLTSEEIADKIQWPARIREDAAGNIWIEQDRQGCGFVSIYQDAG
jgi:ligand-binding sensor domain-containing protein